MEKSSRLMEGRDMLKKPPTGDTGHETTSSQKPWCVFASGKEAEDLGQ
jgi:hypothetical protein